MRTANTLIRLGGCLGWFESSLGAQPHNNRNWIRSKVTIRSIPVYHTISRLMTKPIKWHVRPVKTQISLGIRPVWSESSLCAQWVAKDSSFLHMDSEDDSDQTGRTTTLLVLSWGGSYQSFYFFNTFRSVLLSRLHCRDNQKLQRAIMRNWIELFPKANQAIFTSALIYRANIRPLL